MAESEGRENLPVFSTVKNGTLKDQGWNCRVAGRVRVLENSIGRRPRGGLPLGGRQLCEDRARRRRRLSARCLYVSAYI